MKRNLCVKQVVSVFADLKFIVFVLLCSIATCMSAQVYNGKASYYGPGFHGRKCANGDIYDMYKMTCAHKTLPFGTRLKITNKNNGKSAIVEVTDRGPYAKGRIVDLSKASSMELDMVAAGVVNVTVEVLGEEKRKPEAKAPLILYAPELSNEFINEVPKMDTTIEFASLVR